jgi:hypothetical protein
VPPPPQCSSLNPNLLHPYLFKPYPLSPFHFVFFCQTLRVKDEADHGHLSARSTLVSTISRSGGCVMYSGKFPLLLCGLPLHGLACGLGRCVLVQFVVFFFFYLLVTVTPLHGLLLRGCGICAGLCVTRGLFPATWPESWCLVTGYQYSVCCVL